jgi:group II intron reverse transcriptase/maturase
VLDDVAGEMEERRVIREERDKEAAQRTEQEGKREATGAAHGTVGAPDAGKREGGHGGGERNAQKECPVVQAFDECHKAYGTRRAFACLFSVSRGVTLAENKVPCRRQKDPHEIAFLCLQATIGGSVDGFIRTSAFILHSLARAIVEEKTRIIDLDLASYIDNVQHSLLLEIMARRVHDDAVMHLLKMILKATGKKGVPQGGVISPLLSNLYLNEVDRMLEKSVDSTRRGKSTSVQYARFADDMVILIDAERRSDWLVKAIDRRLREEFAKRRVEINEDKSRMVDLKKGESFTFLGFEYRRVPSLQRKWRPYYAPKLKKRTALFERLREIFRQHISWPVETVIAKINPVLRGWVNYFRVGHSSICFGVVKRWVEEKVRRHLMRARGRKGFGWKRWSSEWLYGQLGLFNNYQLRRCSGAKVAPAR